MYLIWSELWIVKIHISNIRCKQIEKEIYYDRFLNPYQLRLHYYCSYMLCHGSTSYDISICIIHSVISYQGLFQGFATGCPYDVWYRGLTPCRLRVSLIRHLFRRYDIGEYLYKFGFVNSQIYMYIYLNKMTSRFMKNSSLVVFSLAE